MLAHLKSPRPRISGAVRVWCLTGVLVALSLAALLMAADSMAPPLGGIQVPWWTLAAGFAVTEVFVLDVSSSRNERWLTLSEVPLVIGLVYSTPATIVAAQALGVAAVFVLYRREKPLRCAFNVAQRAAATLVAVFVFVPIVHVAGSTWPIIWLAGFAATLSADIAAGILTNAAIALSEGVRMRFEHILGIGLALTFAKTGLALTVVMVMTEYPAGLVVVAIPVAAAFLAARAHVKVRRERDDMVKLQRATGLAQRSLHPDEMLPVLLEHLRDMFHADIAELVLPDQAKDHLASRMGPGGAVAILTPIDLDPTQGVWARVVAEGEGVLLARPIRNPLLAEHFSSLGINDAIVAPVSCEDGPSGILTIANRVGDFSTFGAEDLHLLEALAKHIGVTIRNSRLTLRLEDALEREAETNTLKDDFLATISHELRSPLTSMHGYVKTMRAAGDKMPEKEREEFLAAADRAGERLHSLIEDLLFSSRVETPVSGDRLGPVGLAGLVGRVVEDRLEHLETGRIVLRFPSSQPPVWTNEGDVQRIVSNLLDNALKFSPADTPVTVSADTDGAGVRVSFRNLGAEIPESERERIFDRFYQVDHGLTRSNGGIGLGLHICRRTAESLGGRVWLNESDDSGSVFCLWLPARDVESLDGRDGRRGRAHNRLAHSSASEA
ncbi:MAG TPA: HAMP domain-containing sensor histidine kinase [Actinomycetota bacterium]